MMAVGLAGGCYSSYQDGKVERAVSREARGIAGASNAVDDAFAPAPETRVIPGTLSIDFTNTLQLATRYSRDLQSRRDALFLKGLAALAARREFGVQYAGTVGYLATRPGGGTATGEATASLSASRALPTGGKLSAVTGTKELEGGTNNLTPYTTTAAVELTQPLLAGAGYDASHEAAIQAERDLLYELRSFVRERQEFAIGIVNQYYGLLIEKAVLANARANLEQAVFLRKRSEAMFTIRRTPAVDVMRAQQQELSAGNGLAEAESAFEISGKRFLITLGLPAETPIEVAGEIPELRKVELDRDLCQSLALERRLDLETVCDRRDDARRRKGTARLALLPQLDAYGKVSAAGDSASPGPDGMKETVAGGVTLALPLDRRPEQEALKKSEIELAAAERAVDAMTDSVKVGISEAFSRLVALEKGVGIAGKNMELAGRRLDYTMMRFRNGELSNRDVVEAQGEQLNSRNTLVKATVDYEIQRLRLLREIGALDVGADGVLVELPLPAKPGAE